jgi:NMD protein affecting ribosome stability and mRNA decay
MTKNDSVFCYACGREFTMPLVAMVRRQHRWCDQCVEKADRELQEAAQRVAAGRRRAEVSEREQNPAQGLDSR